MEKFQGWNFFIALTHGQEKPKDTEWRFEWVKNGIGEKRTNSDDYLIEIRIPPIRERQYAQLQRFYPTDWQNDAIDDCIFDGKLEGDPESYVTVTGGCPGDDNFEVP